MAQKKHASTSKNQHGKLIHRLKEECWHSIRVILTPVIFKFKIRESVAKNKCVLQSIPWQKKHVCASRKDLRGKHLPIKIRKFEFYQFAHDSENIRKKQRFL